MRILPVYCNNNNTYVGGRDGTANFYIDGFHVYLPSVFVFFSPIPVPIVNY